MNLRPALRAFVGRSHSCLHSPVALVAKGSAFLGQTAVPQNSSRHNLSRPPRLIIFDSSHLSQVLSFLSPHCKRTFRFGKRTFSTSSKFESRFTRKASPRSASVPRNSLSRSAMSSTPEPSLQPLSLQNPETEAGTVNAEGVQSKAADTEVKQDVLVQYIVIRKDLVLEQNWPLGSIVSQGCHAAVSAIWLHKDDPLTAHYCRPENLDHMHKVVLEVKGETQLRNLSQKLQIAGVLHKLWVEQPENYATSLATKPYYRSQVASHFKKLKLCK
ncbi:hypothetical protein Mapa_008303 [Marchantia paleacea]|nr:hypothetical protein Mapa_008303 [Marchantia paleacea]